MTYKQTIDYLFSQLPMYQRVGSTAMKKNLDNIRGLCGFLNNPQDRFPSIHIAGTNGKGTTAHVLSSLLQEHGYKVGLYTSPHYKDFRERIKINGEYILEEDVIGFTAYIKQSLKDLRPSFFEITVAMAFDYFSKQKVDVAIIETGLGGRLDSTNIITPELSVITNIGFDHMNMLGDTLVQIAGEKAGIIKKKKPVLIGEKQDDVKAVFESIAVQNQSELSYAEDHCVVEQVDKLEDQAFYQIKLAEAEAFSISTPIQGPFQIYNIRTAIAAYMKYTKASSEKGEQIIQLALKNILANTKYIGRWHVIFSEPLVILDSAHNVDGIEYVGKELIQLNKTLHLVLGFVKDKNWQQLLHKFPPESNYYFCKPEIPRGLPIDQIKAYAEDIGLNANYYDSVSLAKEAAISSAEKTACVFIGGSTFVVAEAL